MNRQATRWILLLACSEDVMSNVAPSGDVCVGVGQRELEERTLGCKRGAELVDDVGGERRGPRVGFSRICGRVVREPALERSLVHVVDRVSRWPG